jgi:murein DD-endopeptidase MepM/ murein hydrolase activator NlpD
MGLHPLGLRLQQTRIALRGEEDVPATSFGLSSLRLLRPRMGMRLWSGRSWTPRKAILTNLFNHTQTPIELGWSVEKTQTLDFRGRDMTYDSHNGTDFAIPVGSTICTAAPGRVVRVASEFNRGGLKIFIDHGSSLMTCTAHLARSLVEVGDIVERGQPIALSGYSGLDGVITFPFGVPHIHFNTWFNAEPVDPFATEGQVSMWRGGALPLPAAAAPVKYAPSEIDPDRVAAGIASCITEKSRERLSAIEPLWARAGSLIAEMNYYPTRFPVRILPYRAACERGPMMDLPLLADEFDGVVFADD